MGKWTSCCGCWPDGLKISSKAAGCRAEVLAAVTRAGCLRMFAPARYGGDNLALPEALRVIEALARVDGSTGWVIAQVCLAQLIFKQFPEETLAEVYADGPDVHGAGAVAPKGRASRQDDGWLVVGRWPFVTGCQQSSWLSLNCVVLDGRSLKLAPGGLPELRMALLPANAVEILDIWHAVALRGTGSHDVRVQRQWCSGQYTLAPSNDAAGGSVATAAIAQAGVLIAAVAVGIAQGALDDMAALASSGKRPSCRPHRLAESAVFQDRLGQAHMALRAAHALLHSEATAADRATSSEPTTPLSRAMQCSSER